MSNLYRSQKDSMVGGVCGGLGQYLGIDPTFVRLFFVLMALAGNGIGVFIYLLLWIILPLDQPRRKQNDHLSENVRAGSEEILDQARAVGEDIKNIVVRPHPNASLIIGGALIILGIFYLLDHLQVEWLRWLNFDLVWPLLL
ncbi:MAG TPA: PspC domain-containing protein, partial [Anaerolineales bacterium]|nr:PspC domain-containing protein [Anaerolineales bacterium]